MSLLSITALTHSFGENILYEDGNFELYKGEHVGLVGNNGAGKSTLMKLMAGSLLADAGNVKWKKNSRFGYLDQFANIQSERTVKSFLYEQYSELFEMEETMIRLYMESSESGDEAKLNQAASIQSQLEVKGFYQLDSRIEQMIKGLGIHKDVLFTKVESLSEAQRTVIFLARLLLEEPDVLLLDEPTNFLKRTHTEWLITFLQKFTGAFIVISHDIAFLEAIATTICDIDFGTIKKYSGTYADFIKQKAHFTEDYTRRYDAQQRKIRDTEEFVRKNIAGVNTKMAQGRRKHLERMERMVKISDKKEIKIKFNEIINHSANVLLVEKVLIGYDQPLLQTIDFNMNNHSKVVITGDNHVGKTTLLRTVMGKVPPLAGQVKLSSLAKISYYEQISKWENPNKTPVQVVADIFPSLDTEIIRKALVDCGVEALHVNQPVITLSGGEQAKVRLCYFTLTASNFLILDEPTNHLDNQSKIALKRALQYFKGPILMVSNDVTFYRDFVTEVIHLS